MLLERGPDYGPLDVDRWPADLFDARLLATSHDAGYNSGSRYGSRVVDFQRAHVIGGCSSHNGCIAAVGHPSDYDAWNMPGWAGTTCDRCSHARWSECAFGPTPRMKSGRFIVRRSTPHGRPATAARFALDDLDAGVAFGLEAVNIVDGVRFNAAFAYLDPVRDRPNLTIIDHARVDRLEPTRSGEVTVQMTRSGTGGSIRAARVIVCAGPTIRRRCCCARDRDPTDLDALGIPLVHALPGVGRNLHDHPLIECTFRRSERLQRELEEASAKTFVPQEQTLGKFASSLCEGPYDIHVLPVGASTQVSLLEDCCAIPVSPVCPRARGAVRLRSADVDAAPLIEHNYLEDPDGHDIAVMREAIEIARDSQRSRRSGRCSAIRRSRSTPTRRSART